MAEKRAFATGNSGTKLSYDKEWLVLDLGSGHTPHPRANILADRFLYDNRERSGQSIHLPAGKPFVIADACALPFREGAFDFVICSHVAEHIEDVDAFCGELNRVARRGYVETPSRMAETLRRAPNHRWYVSSRKGKLVFVPAPAGYPLGSLGKLFFSVYFYGNIQAKDRDVFRFAHGLSRPWHYVVRFIRLALVWLWRLLRPVTYTRFRWDNYFCWHVIPRGKASSST